MFRWRSGLPEKNVALFNLNCRRYEASPGYGGLINAVCDGKPRRPTQPASCRPLSGGLKVSSDLVYVPAKTGPLAKLPTSD